MLRFNTDNNGDVLVEQIAQAPLVYLDTWAWVDLSTSEPFRSLLGDYLHRTESTIVYTAATFIEVSGTRTPEQRREILEFAHRHPFAFFSCNPYEVIRREHAGVDTPQFDWALIDLTAQNADDLGRMSLTPVFEDVFHPENAEHAHRLRTTAFSNLANQIACERAEPGVMAATKTRKRKRQGQRVFPLGPPTARLVEAAQDFLRLNRMMRVDHNDWWDVAHLIVPLAYADVVFVDKRWSEFLRQEDGYLGRIARAIDKRGAIDFLTAQ